jgi:hypothetical protein
MSDLNDPPCNHDESVQDPYRTCPICGAKQGEECAWNGTDLRNIPVQTTCIEHAYGTTQRLSFQIRVF